MITAANPVCKSGSEMPGRRPPSGAERQRARPAGDRRGLPKRVAPEPQARRAVAEAVGLGRRGEWSRAGSCRLPRFPGQRPRRFRKRIPRAASKPISRLSVVDECSMCVPPLEGWRVEEKDGNPSVFSLHPPLSTLLYGLILIRCEALCQAALAVPERTPYHSNHHHHPRRGIDRAFRVIPFLALLLCTATPSIAQNNSAWFPFVIPGTMPLPAPRMSPLCCPLRRAATVS